MEWTRTFEFPRPLVDLWAAFVEAPPRLTWNDVLDRAEVDESARRIWWTDVDADIGVPMSMELAFAETVTGARVTLTRSGDGDGEMFDVRQASKLVAWVEAMHDLSVYLDTGIDLRRLHAPHPEHPISATGAQLREEPGGLRVTAIQAESFSAGAGLEPGDLIVRMAGVPVFDRTDLWLLTRLIAPGTATSVQFVRDKQLREAVATMSPIERWATGELGGGPRG